MSDYKPEDLKSKLESSFEAVEHCEVTDLSDGCGGKFNVVVVTPKFDGVALLARHRLVNKALEEELKTIHALTIKAYTPAQWVDKQKATE